MTIHLPNRIKTWINCIGLGVWISGAAWLMVHYWLEPEDAAGLPGSPAGPWWLKIHGAFAFLAIWTGGLVWGLHVVKAWHRRRHRWSGGIVIGSLLLLIVSGYLLYYVGEDHVRHGISLLHWILGLLIPLAYITHRLAKRFPPGRERR